MQARHVVGVLGAALALGLFVGCGGGGSGSSNRVSLGGNANYPGSLGGGPVGEADFIIIDTDRADANGLGDALASGVTTSAGRFFGIIRKTASVAVVISGNVNGQPVQVSGLVTAEASGDGKQLDGRTEIACAAGLQAVIDGDIAGYDLDAERIANLEDAADRFVATTDFTDPASVTASANQVRALTDDGAHPAP